MLLTHLDLHTKRRHHGFQDIDIQQGIMLQVAAHYRSKKCLGKASLCREQLGFYIERRYRVGAKALHSICKRARLGCASALCHQLAIEQNTDHSWPSQPTPGSGPTPEQHYLLAYNPFWWRKLSAQWPSSPPSRAWQGASAKEHPPSRRSAPAPWHPQRQKETARKS